MLCKTFDQSERRAKQILSPLLFEANLRMWASKSGQSGQNGVSKKREAGNVQKRSLIRSDSAI